VASSVTKECGAVLDLDRNTIFDSLSAEHRSCSNGDNGRVRPSAVRVVLRSHRLQFLKEESS